MYCRHFVTRKMCDICKGHNQYLYNRCLSCYYGNELFWSHYGTAEECKKCKCLTCVKTSLSCRSCKESNWMRFTQSMKIYEPNVNMLKRAMQIYNKSTCKYNINNQEWDRGIPTTYGNKNDCIELRNMVITNTTKTGNAVYWYDNEPFTIHFSTYRIRSLTPMNTIPQSNILHQSSHEFYEPCILIITKWAYDNVYLPMVYIWIEEHAKRIEGLIYLTEKSPFFKDNIKLINQLRKENGKEIMNEEEKEEESYYSQEDVEKIAQNINTSNTDIENKELIIFYTDGAGNLYHNNKGEERISSAYGHFNVLRENDNKKWSKKYKKISSNQAEITGVTAALLIATAQNAINVEVKTDSKACISWINGRDTRIKTNIEDKWETKDIIIKMLIDKLVNTAENIPNLQINWISRDINKAHSF